MKIFNEYEAYADRNREAAAKMKTAPTRMADGNLGVTLLWSSFFATMTRDEAIRAAQMIVSTVDIIDGMKKRRTEGGDQPRRKITRSYQEQENQE